MQITGDKKDGIDAKNAENGKDGIEYNGKFPIKENKHDSNGNGLDAPPLGTLFNSVELEALNGKSII